MPEGVELNIILDTVKKCSLNPDTTLFYYAVNHLERKTYVPYFLTSSNCAFCPYIIFMFLVILQKDPETVFPYNFNCMVVFSEAF